MALLTFNDFHSKVHRAVKDDLFRFVRQNAVAGDVADIRLVPIEFNLAAIYGAFPVYRFCRYIISRYLCAALQSICVRCRFGEDKDNL